MIHAFTSRYGIRAPTAVRGKNRWQIPKKSKALAAKINNSDLLEGLANLTRKKSSTLMSNTTIRLNQGPGSEYILDDYGRANVKKS